MYDAFEMNINTHEDAFFCISLFFLLLFCDRKYPVNWIPEHTKSVLAESDVHCKKAHFLMLFDQLVLIIFCIIFQANWQFFIIKYHKLEFGPLVLSLLIKTGLRTRK